jgi:hypothetical protein
MEQQESSAFADITGQAKVGAGKGKLRRFTAVTACTVLLALGAPAVAQAAPGGVKECGERSCTRTYDKKMTREWNDVFQSNGFQYLSGEWNEPGQWILGLIPGKVGKVATFLQMAGLKIPTGGNGKAHEDVESLVNATKEAVRRGGCVQAQWDKSPKDAPINWGYTTSKACR